MVDIPAEWLEIRRKQTTVSEYQDERRKRDERAKALQAELVRDLTKGTRQSKGAGATKAGGGGASATPAAAEDAGSAASRELALVKSQLALALQTASPTGAGGSKDKSGANEARRAANRALTKAGKWTAYDTRKASLDEEIGALWGPVVRSYDMSHPARAGGKVVKMTGLRLFLDGERGAFRNDPACHLEAEGAELCVRNLSNDECPYKDDPSKCNYHHLDPNLFKPHGLPATQTRRKKIDKLPKLLRMFFVALGGCKCCDKVPVEQRPAVIDKLRNSAGSGVLPPGDVYAQVSLDKPLERPLYELLHATGSRVADVAIPAPVRAFSADEPSASTDVASAADGDAWMKRVAARVSQSDAANDFFVVWAARHMAGNVGSTAATTEVVDEAFRAAMIFGVDRAHRTLLPVCVR